MGRGHNHGLTAVRLEKPQWWMLGITGTFLLAEVICGLLTSSLALLPGVAAYILWEAVDRIRTPPSVMIGSH